MWGKTTTWTKTNSNKVFRGIFKNFTVPACTRVDGRAVEGGRVVSDFRNRLGGDKNKVRADFSVKSFQNFRLRRICKAPSIFGLFKEKFEPIKGLVGFLPKGCNPADEIGFLSNELFLPRRVFVPRKHAVGDKVCEAGKLSFYL